MAAFVQTSGGDILRHPSKMDCLESVSKIAQMLTAGYMPSPPRAHSSSETFWNLEPPYARRSKVMMTVYSDSIWSSAGYHGSPHYCSSHVDIYLSDDST